MISSRSARTPGSNSYNWAPGQARDSHLLDAGHHLPLFLSVRGAVIVLHADELGPPVTLGDGLVLHELPCEHAARTNV
jgi:hypothetical protein